MLAALALPDGCDEPLRTRPISLTIAFHSGVPFSEQKVCQRLSDFSPDYESPTLLGAAGFSESLQAEPGGDTQRSIAASVII